MGRKVEQIFDPAMHSTPPRAPVRGVRRVHVSASHVLLFEPEAKRSVVRLLRLVHRDEADGK